MNSTDPSFSFTINDNPEVRQRIEDDLEQITAIVRDGDPNLKALVLTGGFARGEGTVMDGLPQNDYDLIAMRGLGKSRSYDAMAQEAAEAVDLPIDLAPVWHGRMPFLSRSIFWYETATRGRVLWGDQGVLERIPIRNSSLIAPDEAMRLLSNRAAGLLLHRNEGDHENRIQACKALLGALDAHLLRRGLYLPTHKERWRTYLSLHDRHSVPPALANHHDDLEWAYRFKTWPTDAPPVEAEVIWDAAADALLASVPAALRHLGVNDLQHYAARDTWIERVYYWSRARSIGARPWVLHPSGNVRVATLHLLDEARNGTESTPHLTDLVPAGGNDLSVLRDLRRATMQ